jgi:anthranilate synthase component 1
LNIFDVLADSERPQKIALDYDEIDLPGDLETPVSAFLKLRKLGAKFLLESAEAPTSIGRYTFIGIDPLLRIEIQEQQTLILSGSQKQAIAHSVKDAPFDGLKKILNTFELSSNKAEIPLLGGLVGFTSYEIVKFIEPRLRTLLPPSDWPIALYYFVDTLLVFDHYTRRMKLVRLGHQGDSLNTGREHVSLEQIRSVLESDIIRSPKAVSSNGNSYQSNFTQEEFETLVATTQKYIFKGDTFQTVVSQREMRQSEVDSFLVYRALRMLNPSPYMYYLNFDDIELIGSSPEALVKLKGDQATIRPIAGTRKRGGNQAEDGALAEELLKDEKERAEHIMLVDLARNDLGRVCKFGSVNVTEMLHLEYYSHVMHMTSNVTGKLRDDCDQFDLLRSAFPAGTVSGAPKLRAMEIIADLEKTARGPYAGAVGYLSLSRDLDMCITIRTIVKRGETLYLQAGAGIVADSVPSQEYLETRNKIAALKAAVETAERGAL